MNEEERTEQENQTRTEPLSEEGAEPRPGPATAPEPADAAQENSAVLRRELEEAQSRLTHLERERELLLRGVPEEDLDYYVFRIGKLVTEEKDFRTAAKEFLKQRGARPGVPFSTGASLMGRTARPQTANETMNRLLRGE